jgi:hypothetical protein
MSESPPGDAKPLEDVVLLLGDTEEGYLRGIRRRGREMALAELRPLEEGRPLTEGEVVSLKSRAGSPALWDVEVHYAVPSVPAARKGPAKVASAAYRKGWDAVFGPPGKGDVN